MRSWIAIEITVSAAATEAVEHAFNLLNSLGTEINYLARKGHDDVCVIGYFDQEPGNVGTVLQEALATYGLDGSVLISVAMRPVPETDWLAEWKRHWQPSEIGKFLIAPPWADVFPTDKIVIRIEPSMAFGTGTHETTQLCLRSIDEYLCDGMSFIDVGTGTGILAIAAAKAAPLSRVAACDVDEDAVKIARENAEANAVGDRIEFFIGSVRADTPPADFVCANLTLETIKPLLPALFRKANRVLLLSGILTEQEDAVRDSLAELQISNSEFAFAGEWLSVVISK